MKQTTFILFVILIFNSSFSQKTTLLDSCCNNNFLPYYNIDSPLTYIGGFYALKEFIVEKYKAEEYKETSNNTGIIVIHFNVTCERIVKNVTYECFDYDYKIVDIAPSIIEILQKTVSELKDWKLGVNENNDLLCYHKFLTFKLKNGQIIDILPN